MQVPPTTDFSWSIYWILFQTIACFLQTSVQMCNLTDAFFRFPSKKHGVVKGLRVPIERLVPATHVTVKTAGVVPPRCRPLTIGRISFEGGSVNPELSALHQGSTLTGAMHILSEGWKLGLSFYGLAAPSIYVGRTFSVALTYPVTPTTAWAPVRGFASGRTVPSLQHSCPL